MKIYTEVVYYWDDEKGELVKESEKSFDYEGPMTLAEPISMGTAAAVMAAVQLGMSLYGAYTGQIAQEEAEEAERKRREQLKALGIQKFKQQQGIALNTLSQIDRADSREAEIEQNILFEQALKKKRLEGTLASADLIGGASTKFLMNRTSGDILRGTEAIKQDFNIKRVNTLFKKESVMEGLKTDRLNMEYAIAGLTPPTGTDRTAMYLSMVNSGFSSMATYYKYKDIKFGSPETTTTYGGGMGENA